MPRPPPAKVKSAQRDASSRSKHKEIQNNLGEESDSSSFQSVSTDRNATNYNLEYSDTGRNPRHQTRQSVSRSGQSTSKQRSPQRTSPRSRGASVSQSRLTQNTTRQDVGSSRRKTRSPQKRRPGEVGPRIARRKKHILREIRKFQKSTNLLIPRLPFSRVIREILMSGGNVEMRITPTALEAIQESAEIYITQLFADSYRCTLHRDRLTLMVKDMQLVRYLRGRNDPGNL